MTTDKYQKIYKIIEDNEDVIEQCAFICCEIYDKSVDEVNNMNPKKFIKLSDKMAKILNPKKHLFPIKMTTDATKINLGQFIECQEWLKGDVVHSMHKVAASIMVKRKNHKTDSEKLLNTNVWRIYYNVVLFIESFSDLFKRYKGLFEVDEKNLDEEIKPRFKKEPIFMKKFGWIYSAKEVADFHGIKINDAYEMNIIEALNTLSYLKSKTKYEQWQNNQ